MKRTFLYAFLILSVFLGSFYCAAAQEYPKLDISGYKKYEFRQINIDPARNYFTALGHMGESFGYAAGPWQERLRLRIVGQLSNRLSVSYDMEQQPDMPEKYNVKVNYDHHELVFGEFTTSFPGNEFADASKSLNGVMLTSKTDSYNFKIVPSAKTRSSTQKLTSQRGNNTRGPYSLGRGSIVEGSEYVELNGVPQKRGVDYTIDYFEGRITFFTILTPEDEFKYSFEFTNLIDIFFPTLSKRNFFGMRGAVTVDPTEFGKETPKPEPSIKIERESFPAHIREPKYVSVEVSYVPTPEALAASTEVGGEAVGNILMDGSSVMNLANIPGVASGEERARIIAQRIGLFIAEGTSPEEIEWRRLNGDFAGIGGGRVLFTVDRRDSELYGMPQEDLAEKWAEDLRAALSPAPRTKIVMVPTEEVYDHTEAEQDEVTGVYRVSSPPIITFSEELTFLGSTLKKDIDYSINYETGIIRLLTPELPTRDNMLYVTYSHYESGAESEILYGDGSRGPYDLARRNIITGSEIIFVDQIPYVRDLDYVIDYSSGKVVFSFRIRETQTMSIRYRYVAMKLPPPPPKPLYAQSLTLGGTYLTETAKKTETSPTSRKTEYVLGGDPSSNLYNIHDVLDADNTLYLSEYPIVPTDEASFILRINGAVATFGVDYVIPTTEVGGGVYPPGTKIGFRGKTEAGLASDQVLLLNDEDDVSDGYRTGTVKILATLETTSTIEVTYTYRKYLRAEESVFVDQGVMEFNLSSRYRSMVPGSETVYYWPTSGGDIKQLYPNIIPVTGESVIRDYKIDYSNAGGPKITLNSDPEFFSHPAWTVRISFKHVPGSEGGEDDLEQNVVGVDMKYKLGELVEAEVAWARSSFDRLYIAESTTETFSGTGARDYALKSPGEIIEDSENVFLENTLSGLKTLLTKDTDYFMIYSKPGRISFATAIGTFEVVTIDYEYQSLEGLPGEKVKKSDEAFKLALSSRPIKEMSLAMSIRETGRDFNPLGATSLGRGSRAELYSLNYQAGFANIGLRRNFNKDELSTVHKGYYLKRYDTNLSLTNIKPYDAATIGFNYRVYETLDDPLPTTPTDEANRHKHDYNLTEWKFDVAPRPVTYGFFSFTNSNTVRKTISETETVDRKLPGIVPTTTDTDYFRTSNSFKLTDRANFSIDHQINQPIKKGPVYVSPEAVTKEAIVEHSLALDTSYKLNLDLTYPQFMRKLLTNISLRNYSNENKVTDFTKKTRNTSLYINYIPFNELNTSYSQWRDETLSVRVAGQNPRSESNSFTSRYTPLSNLSIGWTKNWNEALQESGARNAGDSNDYRVNFVPPSPLNNLTLRTELRIYDHAAVSKPLTGSESRVVTNSEKAMIYSTLIPHPQVTIGNDFAMEYYRNKDNLGKETDTMNWLVDLKATYRPTNVLELRGGFWRRHTRDNITGDERPRDILSAKATYRVFTWGDATYDWRMEENKGEILSGSYTKQDFTKTSHAVGMNLRIPQDNVILNNIELKGSYKIMSFENRLNHAENFSSSVLSIEGTLNF